ncbi:MAG: LysM peptidoglycan-binding domain-containing protein [Kangiellaceae bacterium]|nr:LysM peptidoglycan-binding domain-containing protein [Kangiellaceae bacterium]
MYNYKSNNYKSTKKNTLIAAGSLALLALSGCSFVEDRSQETVQIIDASNKNPIQTSTPEPIPTEVKPTLFYIVQAGDTLGSIARKVLGNSKRYIEIANLNNLGPYDPIRQGQKLKLPANSNYTASNNIDTANVQRPIVKTDQTYQALDNLLAAEQYNQAIQWLISRDDLSAKQELQSKLHQATRQQVSIYLQQNNPADAKTLLDGLIADQRINKEHKQSFQQIVNSLGAQEGLSVAKNLASRGEFDKAYSILQQAYQADAANLEKNVLFTSVRNQVSENYHQQALRLYRNQQLDEALSFWDKILVINPNDDLALVYKDRVMALQAKLKDL